MKKFMGLALALVAGVAFAGNVYATSSYTEGTYGEVSDYTQSDVLAKSGETISPTDTSKTDNGKNVTFTYKAGNFKMLAEDEENGAGNRPAGYTWIGFKVVLPTGVTQKGDFNIKANGKEHTEGEFGTNYYAEWVGVNADKLKAALEGTPLEYVFEFDWNKDGKTDQTVKIVVEPENITIYPETEDDSGDVTDQEPVWSPEIAQEVKEEIEKAKEDESNPKDDVSKTGDNTAVAFMGIVTLGLSGTYLFKKLHE